MLHKRLVTACCILTLFFAGPVFSAAETVALHPFKGEPYQKADEYFDVLQEALLKAPGSWSPYVIREDENWPADVPFGGFSAILCPRPSVTAGAPYAFTGEVSRDPEYNGYYRLRLYFWDMQNECLLALDELTAPDKAVCEMIMPMLLEHILPAAGKTLPAATHSAPSSDPNQMGPDNKWLHLGLRTGGGSSQWYYDTKGIMPGYNIVSDFWNVNAALQLQLNFSRWFAIQTEANFSADFVTYKDGNSGTLEDKIFWSGAMTVPLLLRLNLTGSHLRAGLYAGAHYYMPLFMINGEPLGNPEFKPDLPGITFGISVGWKAGAGNIFMDGRFEYDGLWFNYGRDDVFYRNSFKMNIGYEWGIGNRAKK